MADSAPIELLQVIFLIRFRHPAKRFRSRYRVAVVSLGSEAIGRKTKKNTHKSSAHWGASTRSCAPPSSAKGTKVVLKSRSTGDLTHWPTLLRDTARSRLCYAGARSLQAWGLRGGGKPPILWGASTRSCAPPNSAKNTKVVLKSLTGDSARWPTSLPGQTRSGRYEHRRAERIARLKVRF